MSIVNFVDYTQIINKDYRILLLDVQHASPTPLQWSFTINELKENIENLKQLNIKFAFIFNVKKLGIISTEYIMEFIKVLTSYADLLENRLIATSVVYEGIIINTIFELIKIFYKTKKPIDFVKDMNSAVKFIDSI